MAGCTEGSHFAAEAAERARFDLYVPAETAGERSCQPESGGDSYREPGEGIQVPRLLESVWR